MALPPRPAARRWKDAATLLAVALTVGATVAGAQTAHAQDVTLTGTWRHQGGDAERERRENAIDRATESMGMFTQGPARGRLREATTPARELRFTENGDRVTLRSGDRDVTLTVGGPAVRGDRGTIQARRQGGRLVVVARGENGARRTTYRLSEDGRRLTLDVHMTSDRLSEAVRYRVTYVRRS